ncbi:MAG: MBL fold metallo-hydrolase [Pseudomonadota bacterium]
MRFSVLSSGSKANCTFVEAAGVRFLVDCGLSGKQAEERLAQIGIAPETLDAVLVTHEHCDHINGVGTLSRRYNIPVYANSATMQHVSKPKGKEVFQTGEQFCVGAVQIDPFSIVHDAADPVGFSIRAEGFKLVICTDLGRVTTLVRQHVEGANAILLESNHDQEMLQACSYTWELKQRIASTHGHLCNDSAGQLLEEILHPELFHVVLGHLSENSNTPTLALETAHRYIRRDESRAIGLRTIICGNIYESLPCLELDVSGAPGVLMSA